MLDGLLDDILAARRLRSSWLTPRHHVRVRPRGGRLIRQGWPGASVRRTRGSHPAGDVRRCRRAWDRVVTAHRTSGEAIVGHHGR